MIIRDQERRGKKNKINQKKMKEKNEADMEKMRKNKHKRIKPIKHMEGDSKIRNRANKSMQGKNKQKK